MSLNLITRIKNIKTMKGTKYSINSDGTFTINKYSCKDCRYDIPFDVSIIGVRAFEYNKEIRKINGNYKLKKNM